MRTAQYKSNKGQFFYTDFLIAITLAMFILGVAILYWNYHLGEINSRQNRMDMQRAAFDSGSYLVKDYLVTENNVFDSSKLVNFTLENYNTSRDQIGLAGYEFYFKLEHTNNSIVNLGGTPINKGGNYSSAANLIVVRRMGILDEDEVIAYLYVW